VASRRDSLPAIVVASVAAMIEPASALVVGAVAAVGVAGVGVAGVGVAEMAGCRHGVSYGG